MKRNTAVAVGALLLACLAWWAGAALSADPGELLWLWPVGLAAGVAVRSPVRWRAVVVGVALVLAAGGLGLGGLDWSAAVGYGVAAALQTGLAAWILTRRGPAALSSDADLRRYLGASLAASVLGAGVVALTQAVTSQHHAGPATLDVAMGSMASLLALLPPFLTLPGTDAVARTNERIAQWTVLVVVAPLTMLGRADPPVVFVIIPILAWGAFRLTPREAVAQLLGVFAVVEGVTLSGHGPYGSSGAGGSDLARSVTLSGFLVICAVMVTPLILRLAEYVELVRDAARERDMVRNIVDSATGYAIIGADRRGRISLFNPGAEQLLGYRPEEVLGRTGDMLHAPETIAAKARELGVADSYAEVVRALVAEPHPGEQVLFRRKDGVERVHAMTLGELTDKDGRRIGYLSTSEDITDDLEAKRALEEALDTERRATERLREVDAVKDAFVSTVSHELRTPITSILGYLELLADGDLGELDAAQLDAVQRVSANSNRLLVLIDNLLTLSRVGEQGVALKESEFDLGEAVEVAYRVLAPTWRDQRRLTVTWQRPEPMIVTGDREMIERVVVNLLGNAVKFTPDGGAVHLDLARQGRSAALMVADTGIGIPEEEQDRLFTRFFRSELARGQAIQGSGLGLSISKEIVEQHGGTIYVQSAVGVGTTVHVRLPAEQPAVAPDAASAGVS